MSASGFPEEKGWSWRIIQEIEKEIEVPFVQMSLEELQEEPRQPRRGYALDDDGRVVGLRLNNTCFENGSLIGELPELQTLIVHFNVIDDFDFLKRLGKLRRLGLSAPFLPDFAFLAGLGILLHFRNDEALADVVFVNPQWISDAVYMILADKDIERTNGRFPKDLLFEKWGDRYTREEKNKLLTLMQKQEFDLVYPAEGKAGPGHSYIAPLLLPDVAPTEAALWERGETLSFQYRYRFMPMGIITRLIVRLNEWIADSPDGQGLVYKSGVILEKEGCRALVKTDISREGLNLIDISIKGDIQNAKDFLAYIRGTIDEVHRQSFKRVEVEHLVPCHCAVCRESPSPTMFEFSRLKKYVDAKEFEILCENGAPPFRKVPIEELLGGVVVQRPRYLDTEREHPFFEPRGETDKILKSLTELARALNARPQRNGIATTPPVEPGP